MFPSLSILALGIFIDPFVTSIEHARYPCLPPARRVGAGELVRSGLRLTILAVVINLALLPVYFLPIVNIPLYYGLNGYLVGRAYFEAVALRRMDLRDVRAMWRWHRAYLSVAGAVMAFLLTLRLIDAAFMLHLFENSYSRPMAKLPAH